MAAEASETYGLVIGVDRYAHIVSLDGAVNDADDITRSLKNSGAAAIITLVDDHASKAAIEAAFTELLDKASTGDTIVMTFAGHGAQIGEAGPGDEADGMDEFFVLAGFDPGRLQESLSQSIFDDELHLWFAKARDRGVRVLFVADSCHAGGMSRQVRGKLRYVALKPGETMRSVPGGDLKGGRVAEGSLENVTMLAATTEGMPIPEVFIDGKPRGALSYSLARALEGYADRDGNGRLSRIELEDYVLQTVKARSDALQVPVFLPLASPDDNAALLEVRPVETAMRSLVAARASKGAQRFLRAAEMGWKPILPLEIIGTDYRPESTANAAIAYRWDASAREFRTPNGEIVAQQVSKFSVGDVVSKFILIDLLTRMSQQNPARIIISPEKQVYDAGDHIKFDAVVGKYRNVLVINLASTGEVQFLDLAVDGRRTDKSWIDEIKVVEPFGGDHLVVIATNEPLDAIGQAVRRGVNADELARLVTARLDGTDTSVAIQPIFTRKAP
jgi:hypothetical protein